MIASMTAFARADSKHSWGYVLWELRSVNHRFLDISLRLPENFRYLEQKIRQGLKEKVSRGKIELTLVHQLGEVVTTDIKMNHHLIQQIKKAYDALQPIFPSMLPVDPLRLLEWPGVCQLNVMDEALLEQNIMDSFHHAVHKLLLARQKEGEALQQFILNRLKKLVDEVTKIEERLPEIHTHLRTKIQERLLELAVKIDENRFVQEIAIQLQKIDIAEEISRLTTHIQATKEALVEGGVIGRRLDFLMQEMHREANTLGAKAVDAQTAARVVEIKVLIEQMREQVQNIE